MNITVYLGASSGNDPTLEASVRALGHLIGESGSALVYGGSKNGLMGALAESVLRAGGEVTGVEPQLFIDKGYEYDEITTLIVTRDMTERKTKMIELGDAFIAFPGGTGTLEEISEIMSKVSLMPKRVIMARAILVACSMSLDAPVVISPNTTSSAARPPVNVAILFSSSCFVRRYLSPCSTCMV